MSIFRTFGNNVYNDENDAQTSNHEIDYGEFNKLFINSNEYIEVLKTTRSKTIKIYDRELIQYVPHPISKTVYECKVKSLNSKNTFLYKKSECICNSIKEIFNFHYELMLQQ